MKVAVLGLGSMGRTFGGRARGAGHEVVGWNRTPGRSDLPEAATALEAVAGTDVAFVVVADAAAVEAVCSDELLASLPPHALLGVISTVAPSTVRALDARLPGRVLDTPVLGAPASIDRGEGRFLVGGPQSAAERLGPLLVDLAGAWTHCGSLGAGAVLKIVSNLQLVIGVGALAEALATARAHGVDDDLLRTVLGSSPVVSATSRLRLEPVLDPAHPGWFPPALAAKDVGLALALAAEAGLSPALGPAAADLLARVADGGWDDFAAVLEGLG